MKNLVVFYSRTGNTRKVAESIARSLEADVIELRDEKDRSGLIGYIRSGFDAAVARGAHLQDAEIDLSEYDRVIIGSPVWAFSFCPAVRTFMKTNIEGLGKVAFFCTQDMSGAGRAFAGMKALCGKAPDAELTISSRSVKRNDFADQVDAFCSKLSQG